MALLMSRGKFICSDFTVRRMVCGTVARSYGDKHNAKVYRPLISHREIYVKARA